MAELIATPDALPDIVARARRAGRVALDTEFVWERTYYPRLGVVQVGIESETFLLDAVALDLAPLGAVLADPDVLKLLHDAEQDLTILRRATGADPVRIFDTQLAAGFVGIGATISLQGLLQELLGIALSKGAQRSDWLQRPLTEEQRTYAAADVAHLAAAHDALSERLERLGRTAWAEEEMAAYDDPGRYTEDDPAERYKAVKGRNKRAFGGRQYAALRALTAWREEEARRRDRPRGHIVPDEALVELAQRTPQSMEKLKAMRGLSANAVSRHGDAILGAIREALASDPDTWPGRAAPPPEDPTLTPRLDLVQAFIRGRAQREALDPALVANRADVERLVADSKRDPARHPLLQGWRRAFIGADLEALLAGRAAVALDAQGLPHLCPIDPS